MHGHSPTLGCLEDLHGQWNRGPHIHTHTHTHTHTHARAHRSLYSVLPARWPQLRPAARVALWLAERLETRPICSWVALPWQYVLFEPMWAPVVCASVLVAVKVVVGTYLP